MKRSSETCIRQIRRRSSLCPLPDGAAGPEGRPARPGHGQGQGAVRPALLHPAELRRQFAGCGSDNRRGWIMGLVFIIIVAVLVTCFFFVDKYMKDRYFITVNANDKIVINQGMSSDILGGLWNTPYQEACLRRSYLCGIGQRPHQ